MENEFNNLRLCVVAPFDSTGPQDLYENPCRHLEEEGVKVYRLNKTIHPSVLQPIKISFGLLKHIRHIEIIHAHACSYGGFLPVILAVMVGKPFGKKIVMTYHGGAAKDFLQRYGFIVKPFLKRVDKIIGPDGFLRDIFNEFGFKAESIPYISDTGGFYYKERGKVKPKLIVVRHLEEIYNIPCALKAFKIVKERYPQAKLKIVGSGSLENKLKSQVEQMGLSDVEFTGQVKYEDMPQTYQSCDILVNPTDYDIMPLTILEPFRCGLPVVSTNAGGIPYFVRDGENGLLVNRDDHVAMAEKTCYLLENPEVARRLARNGKKTAESCSWESVKPKYASLYGSLRQEKIGDRV
ncbi:D-inositol-3-phosphate glycosyltransferase [subsurface metagenome]